MPNKTISDLESIVSLTGQELLPVENNVGTFAASVDDIKDYTLNNSGLTDKLSNKNYIINGDFRIAQRGSLFTSASAIVNNDDTFLLDRWNLLSDGNDIVDVSQELTIKPDGVYSSIKIDQETANKQWGIVQFLEAQDAAALINGIASLSFEARKGGSNSTIGKLRAGIISWSGAADSLTSDIVATWAGNGTNPTLATNWNYENVPSDLTLTTAFQKFKIENVAIDTASAKNIAVFIWLDTTNGTIADLVYISKIKLEYGAKSTPYIAKTTQEEIAACQRFCNVIGGENLYNELGSYGIAITSTALNSNITFPVEMRISPSLTILGSWQISDGVAATPATSITIFGNHQSKKICGLQSSVSSGLTQYRPYRIEAANSLSSLAIFSAEL